MKRIAVLAAALALAGCADKLPGEAPMPATVQVPVAVTCTPDIGPAPQYPDTDTALAGVPDIFEGVKLLKAGRLMRIAREAQLNAALAGCAAPAKGK